MTTPASHMFKISQKGRVFFKAYRAFFSQGQDVQSRPVDVPVQVMMGDRNLASQMTAGVCREYPGGSTGGTKHTRIIGSRAIQEDVWSRMELCETACADKAVHQHVPKIDAPFRVENVCRAFSANPQQPPSCVQQNHYSKGSHTYLKEVAF